MNRLYSWGKDSKFCSLPQSTTAFRMYWFHSTKQYMWCQAVDGEHVEWIIYHPERVSLSTGIIRKTALWTETLISKLRAFLEVEASDVERPLEGEVCMWEILHSEQGEMQLSHLMVSLLSVKRGDALQMHLWPGQGFTFSSLEKAGRVKVRTFTLLLVLAAGLQGRWVPCTSKGNALLQRLPFGLTPSGFWVHVCCHKC